MGFIIRYCADCGMRIFGTTVDGELDPRVAVRAGAGVLCASCAGRILEKAVFTLPRVRRKRTAARRS